MRDTPVPAADAPFDTFAPAAPTASAAASPPGSNRNSRSGAPAASPNTSSPDTITPASAATSAAPSGNDWVSDVSVVVNTDGSTDADWTPEPGAPGGPVTAGAVVAFIAAAPSASAKKITGFAAINPTVNRITRRRVPSNAGHTSAASANGTNATPSITSAARSCSTA
jgi:hypothetical protein